MRIGYLDGPRLRRALLAMCEHGQRCRAELNRINVFPVPDGDTGTNLALTLRSISDRLRANRERAVGAVALDAADAAVLGARGNCGMIFSHFLLGFSDGVRARARMSAVEFSDAMAAAVRRLYEALERPVEGTILTVMRETSEEAQRWCREARDFAVLAERLVARARASLASTTELLPQLRAAGVVDAGAKGFVHCLEGILAYINGEALPAAEGETSSLAADAPAAAALAEYSGERERYRFCTEALVRGAHLPSPEGAKGVLRGLGDSLIAIRAGDILKVHVHTDAPEKMFAYLRSLGHLLTHKAEDMRVQHAVVERAASAAAAHVALARRPISIVTDSACDLPEAVVRAHGIHVVPLGLVFGDRVLRDGLDIDADGFVELLRAGEHPTTSQPPPAAFLEAFGRAAGDGETVLAVILGSTLSGTFASAEAAARRFPDAPVRLVDSLGASLLQGLLVLRAAELAERGRGAAEIAADLGRVRERSGLFFTVHTFDRLIASGRVSRRRAWLGGILDIKPILALDARGRVFPAARARGRDGALARTLELLDRAVPAGSRTVRFGVMHVDSPEMCDRAEAALCEGWPDAEVITGPATPVLATHTGPGAWGIAYLAES